MKNRTHVRRLLATLAGAILLLTLSTAHAQTYIWADNAQGQPYEVCPSGLGPRTNYYPSNSIWSQSVQTNGNCNNTGSIIDQPSNWDPAPPLGIYPGGPGAVGVDVIIGAPAPTVLNEVVILNSLTIATNGQLDVLDSSGATANLFDFQGDGNLLDTGISGGTPAIHITPGGKMVKSGGLGTFSIGLPMTGTNNLIEVDSGTLAFPTGFSDANLDGGTFDVANNATLLLTMDDNATVDLEGNFTGVGGGTVLINTGAIAGTACSLNLPGSMFQWTGGTLEGVLTNNGVFNAANSLGLSGCELYNNGTFNLADNSSLNADSFHSSTLYNQTGGIFNIEGNSTVINGGIYNDGLFLKSAGAGVSVITSIFNNDGGTVEVDTGTLALNVSGGGYISNATFVVSNGATIDLITNNYDMEIEGALTGTGGGTVLMSAGTLSSTYATTFNFPGSMFQWQGGKLGDDYINNVTNLGTMNVSGPVGLVGYFVNSGTMIQSGTGSIGPSGQLENNAGALYDIQNDGGISLTDLYNYGLFQKSAGTGTSQITANLNNYGPNATVEVDSGTVALSGNNLFTNTSFVVSNGATLDLATASDNNTEIEGLWTGVGGGTVLMSNGIIYSSYQATLDFPDAMFQCQGGTLGNTTVVLNNIGTVNVSGPVALSSYAYMANNGTMIQSGNGSLGHGVGLNNYAGGVYDLQNDGTISTSTFNNYGLFEKTSGTNASLITANFNNWGAIEAPGGSILFSNSTFTQNRGTVQFSPAIVCQSSIQENGGTITGVGAMGNPGNVSMTVSGGVLAPGNPTGTLSFLGHFGFSMASAATFSVVLGGSNQFSQLTVPNSSATVAGTLNVTLANGYAPTIGTQFQIVSTGSRGGTFSTLHVPPGISVTYSNIGVFLTVTSTVPPDLSSPMISITNSTTNFTFNVGTLSNQNYTIQQNTDLSTTNWTSVTNFTGNGSFFQFITPVTNIPQLFFRVVQP